MYNLRVTNLDVERTLTLNGFDIKKTIQELIQKQNELENYVTELEERLEKKLDTELDKIDKIDEQLEVLNFAPPGGGPMYIEAKTSFETNTKKLLGE